MRGRSDSIDDTTTTNNTNNNNNNNNNNNIDKMETVTHHGHFSVGTNSYIRVVIADDGYFAVAGRSEWRLQCASSTLPVGGVVQQFRIASPAAAANAPRQRERERERRRCVPRPHTAKQNTRADDDAAEHPSPLRRGAEERQRERERERKREKEREREKERHGESRKSKEEE